MRDEEEEDGQLEEGEEYESEYAPVASCSYSADAVTVVAASSSALPQLPLPPPPPPPPAILRLVIHHSTQNPSANLLPAHQSLALLDGTTTIGRDKSYEPRIRLKTLEASRTHATLYQQEEYGSSHSDNNIGSSMLKSNDATRATTAPVDGSRSGVSSSPWYIVDNASTHGTFVRRHGHSDYTRLSEKGQSSLPRQLRHME